MERIGDGSGRTEGSAGSRGSVGRVVALPWSGEMDGDGNAVVGDRTWMMIEECASHPSASAAKLRGPGS
jgi:hypothetical protein